MQRSNMWVFILAVATLVLWRSASGAVVGEITDPRDDMSAGEDAFRTFPSLSNGASTDLTQTASDGNKVLTFVYPNYSGSNFTNGYVWDLNVEHYSAALGTTGSLQNGWVVRHSAWLAMDPNDPLLNEGTWTESFKFEFARNYGGQGGAEYMDTGALIPIKFTPNTCDIQAGTCSNPGDGFQISTTQWTQISMQYEIDELDFSGPLAEVISPRPVLFLGDYTSGEAKQGTLFIDNIVVEVFADLATANATSLPNNMPGGIPHAPSVGVPGDYNGNSVVDAADYTVWRDTLGSTADLRANGDDAGASMGVIDQADYDFWKTRFGNTSGSGAVAGGGAVPEPSSLVLTLLAATAVIVSFKRSSGE